MQNPENKQAKAGAETDGAPYHRLKLNKIIDAAMRKYRSLYTYSALRPDLRKQIEQCVCEKFSDLHTPDHPTYALMIWRAIEGLNEEKGSTEEAISKFIKEDVKDLPRAHANFLRHHLNKLSESGEIVKTSENCYKLPAGNKISLKRKRWQLNVAEGQVKPIEEQKPAEERSEPVPHANYIEKQIQLQEEQILLIEKLIELQWQKNEAIEKQNKLQTEVRSKMIGLSDLNLSKEPENGEAAVRSQSSYFAGRRLENDGSSLLSKVSKHGTLKPVMEEQEKENLMKPEHKQQVEFSNQRRPPRHEVETSQKKSIKKKMQVKKFCGQQEVPECQTKPTRTSSDVLTNSRQLKELQQEHQDSERGLEFCLKAMETENVEQEASISRTSLNVASGQPGMKLLDFPEDHSELCSHPMPLELLPIMRSLDVLPDSQELEHVEQLGLPYSGGPLLLKSSRLEPSGQKEQQLKATLCGKGKARDYQLEQEQQEQQPTQGQDAYQTELAVDNAIKKSLPSQQHHRLQQLVHKDQASPLKLRAKETDIRELLSSHDMHCHEQQPQEEGQGWQRPHRQNDGEDQTAMPLFSLAHRNRCKQQQLEYLDQGRQLSHQSQGASQPERAVNDTVRDSLPSKNWNNQQQQLERKGQVRPPKFKPNLQVSLGGLLLSDDQHYHGPQLPKHQSRGRPPKSKGDIDPTTTAILALPTVLQNQGQTELPATMSKADADLKVSIPMGNQKHNELQQQQPKRQDRGRPPKRKQVLATTMEASLPSLLQERLKHTGRGRPPKRRLEQKS
ncbi:uncharacterized protein LOC122307643 isoform X2 [Carya illinoinensis]|uniref:uncharacterized protein LOC122307643 isoform X2 n=1 Tax=Carya illinoinensis TaxID=32201 RepID=UPI001C71EB12|nr:uncharacterized protein LOC122307643 isoform X2 [Carya illinoinensis]